MAIVFWKGECRMNKRKRVFWGFLSLDYKAIETYLEEMAQKGWMLEKVGRWIARFRAIEPKALRFNVDVFKDEGPLSPMNTNESEEYRNLCKESGWNFITSRDHLQFFYAEEGENPTPIQTDDVLEQKIVESTLWKTELIGVIISTALIIWVMTLYFPPKYTFLLSFVGVAGTFVLPLLFLSGVVPVSYGLIRILKAKKDIERGLPIEKPDYKSVRRRIIALNIITLIFGALIASAFIADSFFRPKIIATSLTGPVIGLIIGLIFRYFIKKRSTDKKDNVLYVTFAIMGVVFLSAITNSFLSGVNMDSGYKIDSIPEGYPIITISDLLAGDQKGELLNREFDPGMSPIVPKHYALSELWFDNISNTNLYVRYYKTINPGFAQKIFKGIISEMERGMKWRGMTFFEKTIIYDNDMKNLWKVDELALTEELNEIIVLKGNIVVRLFGDIDFEDKYVRELISDKFFTE